MIPAPIAIAMLTRAVGRAESDAQRFDRQPNGECLARVRRRDAEILRGYIREQQR